MSGAPPPEIPVDLVVLVEREDVGVREVGHDSGLSLESFDGNFIVGQLLIQRSEEHTV